jgi:hypothetical protein
VPPQLVGPQTGGGVAHCLVVVSQVLVPLHTAQGAPFVPQAGLVVPAMHWPLRQQPDGHEVGVHVHWPLTHAWPVAQVAHSAPLRPHRPSTVSGICTQPAVASQQPPVQLLAEQVGGGGGVSQICAVPQTWVSAVQSWQATPPLPQLVLLAPGTQAPVASQQPAQAPGPLGPHAPATHCFRTGSQTWSVTMQSMQACPSLPHMPELPPSWQTPL